VKARPDRNHSLSTANQLQELVQKDLQVGIMSAVSKVINRLGPAVVVSLLPKAAGSIARVGDDWNAPKTVRRATAVREATTLAQVATYAFLIERSMRFFKADVAKIATSPEESQVLRSIRKVGLGRAAEAIAKKGEKSFLVSAMQKLEKNEPLFLAGLAFTSNISAEIISRKFFPRNLWGNPKAKTEQSKPAPPKVDEARCQPIPVVIEICEIPTAKHLPARNSSSKNSPVKDASKNAKEASCFEVALKTQPIQFTSRPAKPASPFPAVNPFQLRMS
jgi:hypothetical protein